tara:strand:+ start:242 stop:526 length:285 start_codon:yes stop_codon:yes gene_type:complete
MNITPEEIDRLTSLAHLTLSESEKRTYQEHLQSITNYVKKLNLLNLDQLVPSTHATTQSSTLREDIPINNNHLLQEKNAPIWEENAFRVPRILE